MHQNILEHNITYVHKIGKRAILKCTETSPSGPDSDYMLHIDNSTRRYIYPRLLNSGEKTIDFSSEFIF